MRITIAEKTRLREVKELCDAIIGAYVMRDYDIVIALLHKVAYHYVKICERKVK